ncbi:MAG: ankyrin repeat domain-containing protein [Chloroflexota bacterium]
MTQETNLEAIRTFMIAAHGNLDQVKTTLAKHPEWLNVVYDWGGFAGNTETPVQAAAHVGNRPIAEYLLDQGVPLQITTAAMLGRQQEVERLLQADPANVQAVGGHGISLMNHAVYSMNTGLMQFILDRGAKMDSKTLFAPIAAGRADVVIWLVDHGAKDMTVRDFRGKTPLVVAVEEQQSEIADYLRAQGAVE